MHFFCALSIGNNLIAKDSLPELQPKLLHRLWTPFNTIMERRLKSEYFYRGLIHLAAGTDKYF